MADSSENVSHVPDEDDSDAYGSMARHPVALDNLAVCRTLERVADLLAGQRADPFRVRAYRAAAATVLGLDRQVVDILNHGGEHALVQLPHIGRSIGGAISELAHTGHLRLLDRLEGHVSPEDVFMRVPGLGEVLAHRLHDALHIETLEELELAAHDGRLAKVSGFGPRRVQALRGQLAAMLARSMRRGARLLGGERPSAQQPPVELLLAIDARYRELARTRELRKIAPRRFNPRGVAWLPVMHAESDGWSFHAMFSNTARAHRLKRTYDWVVIFSERDGHESQYTVVTEYRGPDAERRVVRGRERECHALHDRQHTSSREVQRAATAARQLLLEQR